MEQTKTIAPETLQDAVDVIRVAMALGMPFYAPVGTRLFSVTMTVYSNDSREKSEFSLGLYATEEAAHIAVRNWVISEWNSYMGANDDPFGDSPLAADGYPDYSARTDEEIIDRYFHSNQWDSYSIVETRVLPAPKRRVG